MPCKLQILPSARMDLAMIEDWYRANFDDDTALKVTNTIVDALERVTVFPDSGKPLLIFGLDRPGLRVVYCKRHAAVYRHLGDSVYVYHIFDTRRDYLKILRHTDFEAIDN